MAETKTTRFAPLPKITEATTLRWNSATGKLEQAVRSWHGERQTMMHEWVEIPVYDPPTEAKDNSDGRSAKGAAE